MDAEERTKEEEAVELLLFGIVFRDVVDDCTGDNIGLYAMGMDDGGGGGGMDRNELEDI